MMVAIIALPLGLRYLAGVLAIAFVLCTIRTLWLASAVDTMAAVGIEVPLILAVSWWWGGRLIARQPLSRAVMGGSAFVGPMLAEFGLAIALGRARIWRCPLRLTGCWGWPGSWC